MCISKAELDKKVQEIRKYKAMAEEAAEIQKALEAEVITYMVENGLDTEIGSAARRDQHLTKRDLKKTSAVWKSTQR